MSSILEIPELHLAALGFVKYAAPQQGGFSGHETFTIRHGWLKKGLDGAIRQPDIFSKDSAMVDLGVGKNMVRSIRHWGLATGLLRETTRVREGARSREIEPTELGRRLLLDGGWDPYLEDDASLWVVQWSLATNLSRAAVWYWVFNVMTEYEFTRDSITAGVRRYAEVSGWPAISFTSLKADVSCLVRTYVPGKRGQTATPEETLDCPLAALNLMGSADDHSFRFATGAKESLPANVFAFALIAFWDAKFAKQRTLSIREIVHGEGSPGRIFRLDEDAVLGYLDQMEALTTGRILFSDTAMSRQAARMAEITGLEMLDAYYNA